MMIESIAVVVVGSILLGTIGIVLGFVGLVVGVADEAVKLFTKVTHP